MFDDSYSRVIRVAIVVAALALVGCSGDGEQSAEELADEFVDKVESQGYEVTNRDAIDPDALTQDCAESDLQEGLFIGAMIDEAAPSSPEQPFIFHMAALHTFCGDEAVRRFLDALADTWPQLRVALDDDAILDDFDDLS